MAIYRTIQLSFWTDNKVVDEFTPEDKYFYLYLCTNPQTNLCGCYEVSLRTMSNQLGYNKETVERLLDRFEKVHDLVMYSKETKEILLLNWYKYNWQGGEKQIACILKEISQIKDRYLYSEMCRIFDTKFGDLDTPCKGYGYPLDTTVTVTDTVNNNSSSFFNDIKDIIDYLNIVTNSNYTYKSKSTNSLIQARLKEGFTVDDFKMVIDKKNAEWGNDEKMAMYLRPATLFAPSKFESYLNQKTVQKKDEHEQYIDRWKDV